MTWLCYCHSKLYIMYAVLCYVMLCILILCWASLVTSPKPSEWIYLNSMSFYLPFDIIDRDFNEWICCSTSTFKLDSFYESDISRVVFMNELSLPTSVQLECCVWLLLLVQVFFSLYYISVGYALVMWYAHTHTHTYHWCGCMHN